MDPPNCKLASDRNQTQTVPPRDGKSRPRQSHQNSSCTGQGQTTIRMVPFLLIVALSAFALSLSSATETASVAAKLASRLKQSSGARIMRQTMDLGKSSSGPINEWLVHQVAPAVATKLIDNVLHSADSSPRKSAKSAEIDTHALADKIVDTLADSIKNKKRQQQEDGARNVADDSGELEPAKGSSRRGKSLVQSLFSRDNRNFFGRAMEKSQNRNPLFRLHGSPAPGHQPQASYPQQQQHHHHHHQPNSSWQMVREPVYEIVSTDSSQLDENPVVLRAEHGHNSTAASAQQSHFSDGSTSHNLTPMLSNLVSNQLSNKLMQKHKMQQKYVHTNRHHQQHLAPKPWPSSTSNQRRQQQSPYSLPVTSDMNIVQAPSSPAPPIIEPSTTTTTTTTSTSTTTPNPFSFHVPSEQSAHAVTMTQLGPNKFKINNKHQHPIHTISSSPSSWYSTNSRHQPNTNNHRYQHHHAHHPTTSTSTTTTTTSTTTTTTTPEPLTEPPTESIEPMLDLDQQTSSPVSSILSSVAQSALDSLSQSNSGDDTIVYNNHSNNSNNSSSPNHSTSSSSLRSSATKGGASPSTTSARHSVITAEAIPTALGAPLYHLNRANFTATSFLGPPPKRSSSNSVAAKAAAQYLQKGLTNLSSTIFGRQNKSWARRLGISSMLLSGILYGAAILANPGAPLPTTGLEVLKALTKSKRRRGSRDSLLPPINDAERFADSFVGPLNAALLDNNANILQQQPHLIPIIEHLIQQEQQQQLLLSQRSSSPIEIQSFESASRRASPSQYYTLRASNVGDQQTLRLRNMMN